MKERKLNILYLAHEGHMGGASKSLVALAEKMKEKGHHVTVVSPFKNSEMVQELEKRQISHREQFYMWWQYPSNEGFLIRVAYILGYRTNFLWKRMLCKKLKNQKFDLIHTNSSVLDMGIYLKKHLNLPQIWHFREFGEEDLGTKYILGKEKSMHLVNQYADQIIYISKAMQEHYSKWIKKEKGRVIYNGIDKEYLLEKKPEQKKTIRFLISGALQKGKGQECAIQAASLLKQRGYENFVLVIAGRNIAGYESTLKEMAEKNALKEQIEFKGFTKEIQKLRKECDVELVCSHKEAFGRVTVEAMMSSNPVIATRAGANPELIREGSNGLLFEVDQAEQLADCMERFLKDPDSIYRMGREAYQMAKESYTARKNADAIEQLYQEIVSQTDRERKA